MEVLMALKDRLSQLFMSKEQIIYLVYLFIFCVVYGGFAATFTYYQIGLGTRFYSLIISVGCAVGVIHAFISADIKKKRWVFVHYRMIDLAESVFFTLTELGFLAYYFINNLNPLIDEKPVLNLIFFWSIFYRIVDGIVSVIIPKIGDVFEQSLYKNQIDYQNHTNAEDLMCCLGAAIGAGFCFIVGDFFKDRPYWIFSLVILDWLGLWSRWQFYFKPSNYSIIKRNFAKDSGEKLRKLAKKKVIAL